MTLTTSIQISRIKKIQVTLSLLYSLICMNGHFYPDDTKMCNGATYDYVVVGCGTAGSVVTARLVEAGYSVLAIEAGGNTNIDSLYPGLVTYLKNSRVDWNFTSESNSLTSQCHKSGGSSFGKVIGGSGATNYMLYGRGNRRDYEKFYEATGDPSWNWSNMLKYFKRSEKLRDLSILNSPYKILHGTKGKIGVTKENRPVCDDYLQGFEEAGETVVTDNIGAGKGGYSSALYHIFDGVRNDAGITYITPLKYNPKLHITRNSLVIKILFDKNKNAVGVQFVKKGKTFTVKARKEVIVTAGAIKSPQLLMLSGIGPRKELEKFKIDVLADLPVGEQLQNVVGALLSFKTNRKRVRKPFNAHLFPAPLVVGYSALNKSSIFPDYETLNFIIDDYEYLLSLCGFTFGLKNSICDKLCMSGNKSQILLSIVVNINTKSYGNVTLRSTDPFDQPRINYGYFSNKDDLDNLVEYILDVIKIERSPHFQKLGLEFLEITEKCGKYKFGSREYWKCYALCMITTSGRDCGTCAMGSVVDNRLNVFGVKKLRVVDASAMPNTVGSAIFASVVAFAEKAAEMIIDYEKSGI